jgi:hypothetical protein
MAKPSESDLCIRLPLGEIWVVGMDKPERIEGQPWDGGVLDEYANMKERTWGEHVQPALADRNGWCDFIGVPEGRNHYYNLYDWARGPESGGDWGHFTWPSKDILPEAQIEAAKRDLDPIIFAQEYEASFVNFAGRAYYNFDAATHCARLEYDRSQTLIFCFDFNVDPGVAGPISAAGRRQRSADRRNGRDRRGLDTARLQHAGRLPEAHRRLGRA